jgi:hypothetical protein
MLPWLFEAARPETTFCASYACPDLRKLISDTVSTAGGTDPIQERFLTLQQSRATYKNRRAFRRSKDSGAAPRLINVVAGHVGTR